MALVIGVQTEHIEGVDVLRERLGNSGNIRRELTPVLRRAARLGAETARAEAPKGATHELVDAIADDAITFRIRGNEVQARFGVQPVVGRQGGSPLYPLFVHEGTGIYGRLHRRITPRRAKYMVFMGHTGLVFARSVRGQRPQPYMTRAYEVAQLYVETHLDEMVDRIVG